MLHVVVGPCHANQPTDSTNRPTAATDCINQPLQPDHCTVAPHYSAEKELQLDAMSALNHATYEEEWMILDLRLEDQLSRRIEVPPTPQEETEEPPDLMVQAIK